MLQSYKATVLQTSPREILRNLKVSCRLHRLSICSDVKLPNSSLHSPSLSQLIPVGHSI